MGLRDFIDERAAGWSELEALVRRAGRRPETLGGAGVLRLGELYRSAAADLAAARRAYPGDPTTRQLEQLVLGARRLVYATTREPTSPMHLFATRYWQSIASRPLPLAASALLLFGSALAAALWALHDPIGGGGLVPAAYRHVVEPPPAGGLHLSSSTSSALAAEIFTNNIRVTAMAFALGITLGLGTIYVLLENGLLIGAVGGLAWGAGNGSPFLALVLPHGLLELTCICVAGAAGLRLGWSIVEAGPRPRLVALQQEAVESVVILVGTAPWLVAAGLVEGFVTPRSLGLWPALAVGLALGVPFWSLLAWRGFVGVRADRLRRERAT